MEIQDPDVAEYRPLSGAAVVGLILGLLSPVAFVDPVAWSIPLAGIPVSAYAILHIRRNATILIGRKAALAGLWLSLCFAAAAPADRLYYRYRIRQEAKQYAALWFELLAEGRPEMAYQFSVDQKKRQPLDDNLWEYYCDNPTVRLALDHYVAPAKEGEKPQPVRTLLALGKSAKVQYLDALNQASEEGMDILYLRYAVTYEEAGANKTFLLVVQLLRRKPDDGPTFWKIQGCAGIEEKKDGE